MTDLYNGKVLVKFNAGNHRYTVSTDGGKTWNYKVGVTTILRIIAKEALMMWPLDEALKYLFGQKFEEQLQDSGDTIVKPIYTPKIALLKPDQCYTIANLQSALEESRKAHTTKRDKGGDIGTEVHAMIQEAFLNGETDYEGRSKEAIKAYEGWEKWWDKLKPQVIGAEQVVFSVEYDYCGTFDALININDKVILVDWKTSNASRTAPKGIYSDNFIQLGGYALAYEEEHGQFIDDLMVVNLSKAGNVSVQLASDIELSVEDAKGLFRSSFSLFSGKAYLDKKLKETK